MKKLFKFLKDDIKADVEFFKEIKAGKDTGAKKRFKEAFTGWNYGHYILIIAFIAAYVSGIATGSSWQTTECVRFIREEYDLGYGIAVTKDINISGVYQNYDDNNSAKIPEIVKTDVPPLPESR